MDDLLNANEFWGVEAEFSFDEIQRGKLNSPGDLYASSSDGLCQWH